MPCFRAPASDVSVSVMVAADCHVLEVLPHSPESVAQFLTNRHRITSLNGQPVWDRCELRQLLNALAPNSIVEVEYALAMEHGKRVEIQGSVECNGSLSNLAPQQSNNNSDFEEEEVLVQPPHTSAFEESMGAGSMRFNNTTGGNALDSSYSPNHQPAIGDDSSSPSGFFVPTDSPRLLAFETVDGMDATLRAKETKEINQATIRQKLFKAISKAKLGSCIICVCVDVNPIAEIELLALQLKQTVVTLDVGVKLRHRPKPDVVAQKLGECMRNGNWFVLNHSQKSINTLRLIDSLIDEMRNNGMRGVHGDARIFLCTEPHPHFPVGLTHGAVLARIHTSFAQSSLMSMTMASLTSTTCCRLVQAAMSSTDDGGNQTVFMGRAGASVSLTAGVENVVNATTRNNTNVASPHSVQKKKRVRLSAAVDIVDIEPRELFQASPNAPGRSQSSRPIDVSGSVSLANTFSGILNDKFLCIKRAGESGRYAVGSSLGNVYFLDDCGSSMLQVHAHDACIWDVSFTSKYEFATASEDCSASQWAFAGGNFVEAEDEPTLDLKLATMLGADVYCVCYSNQRADGLAPLVAGGLANHLVLQRGLNSEVVVIPTPSNCQALSAFPDDSNMVVVGGGDGSVSLVDISGGGTIVKTLTDHSRKVPTLTIRDANQFFTGSFDSTIRAWDARTASNTHATHTLKLKNYVTGLFVDDVHLAASVGENLYLWDVRKLNEVLGGFPQGWKGLSRGIVVQSSTKQVVTASPDGSVRFWNFV